MIRFSTIKEQKQLLQEKKITPIELKAETLRLFKEHDGAVKSAIEIFEDVPVIDSSALSSSGIAGTYGLVKDNICQKNKITSCASKMLANFVSPYDATAVQRLKDAGAYSIGRANCDEFAMGSSTETSYYGKTYNPWDTSRVPGGSSGGSIAAVAAGLVPWALGSETGGSVRQPAAFCGISGLKPTYGCVSRYGLVAYASSLDQIGIAARTAYDIAAVLSEIAGHDVADSTTIQSLKKHDYTLALDGKMPESCKIAVLDPKTLQGLDPEIAAAYEETIRAFELMGATVSTITLPLLEYGAAIYFMISRAEAASNLSRFDGVRYGYRCENPVDLEDLYMRSRGEGFGHEVKRRILIGNYVLSASHTQEYYDSARIMQAALRNMFVDAFKNADLILMPTTSVPAFKFGQFSDPLEMDLQDYLTAPANLAGIPSLAIPVGFTSQRLPIGMQLMGIHQSEEYLLKVADAYQAATDWHMQTPA